MDIYCYIYVHTISTCEWIYIVTHVHHSHLQVDKYCYKCTCIPYPLASGHTPQLLFIAINHMRVDIYYNTDTPFPPASGHTLVLQLLHIHRHYPLASGHTLLHIYIYTIPTCEWTYTPIAIHRHYPLASRETLLHIYTIPTCEWTYTPIAIHRHYPLASGYTLLHMYTLPTCEWTYITTCVHHSHLRVDIHWYSNCYSPPLSTCEWIYFGTHVYPSHLRVDIHPNIHRRYPLASGSRIYNYTLQNAYIHIYIYKH